MNANFNIKKLEKYTPFNYVWVNAITVLLILIGICKMCKKREHKKEMQFSDSYIFGHSEGLYQLTIIGILGMAMWC